MTKVIPPSCYTNWQNKNNKNCVLIETIEYPLFTDAISITSEIINDNCPYKILNPNVIYQDNIMLMRLVLRLEKYAPQLKNNDQTKTDLPLEEILFDFYLQQNTSDQIASLISLILGVRFKAGAASRYFLPNDNYGTPIAYLIHTNPPPIRLTNDSVNIVLPSALTNIYDDYPHFSLSTVKTYLASFSKLKVQEAEILIRAAKLYRDALWIIESEPELAWIMLISAIEIVAKGHAKLSFTSLEIFQKQEEELANKIMLHGGQDLLAAVADKFVDKKYIMNKYKEFLIKFLPDPPPKRPPANMQINWNDLKQESNSKNPLMKVYEYRSRALHAGVSFPPGMFSMPRLSSIPYHLAEIPTPINIITTGGHKKTKSGPMMLSIFEYIVRNSLLNWWKSLNSESVKND